MESLVQDVRYGLRVLRKRPAFTAVAVIAVALGVGANTAIFSIVNGLLLSPLPYKEPDRLVMVWMNNARLKIDQDWHSYPNYADYRDQSRTIEQLAAFNNRDFNLTGDGEPERVSGAIATSNLFPLLGVEPALGRVFTPEEDVDGKDLVVVLGNGLWKRRFGSDPNVVGKTLSLDGVTRTIVGVMPAGFEFPEKTELWAPLAPSPDLMQARGAIWLQAVGRLAPGATLEQAQADLGAVAANLAKADPQQEGYGVNVVRLHDQVVGGIRPALLVLMAAVAFVLLIACANVANLLLARASQREREIAIRSALGAGRWRVVRQLLTETVLLFLTGGAAGAFIAMWGITALAAMAPADVPRIDEVAVDGRVLAFTFGVSLLTGLAAGLVPALQASRAGLGESLKEGGALASGGPRSGKIRGALVVSEVALSLMLLIGAGLLIRSFVALLEVAPGFEPKGALTMRVQLAGEKYKTEEQRLAFHRAALERIAAVPGVESVGGITDIFLSKTPNSTGFSVEGRPDPPPAERIEVPLDTVTPGFFRTIGARMLRGREFGEQDGPDAPPVVIVNETMANRFWPGEDAVGKRFKYGPSDSDNPWMTIVGVVADMRRTGFDEAVRCETFLPIAQNATRRMTLVARTSGDPSALAGPVRARLATVDPDLPVFKVATLENLIGGMLAQRRLIMALFGIFAGLALVLAAVGVYGVISFTVARRTHEIGIRMALGAAPRDVLRLVLGGGMHLVLVGIGVGLVGALALSRVMTSLLFGVGALDPLTFALIPFVLTAVALLACYVPARRAMKVDPIVALRHE